MQLPYLVGVTISAVLSLGTLAACSQPPAPEVSSPNAASSPVSSPDTTSANTPSPSTVSQSPSAATGVVKSGSFVAAEHPTNGTARIVVQNGKYSLEFDASFRTNSGPDLYVVLHRASNILATTTPPAYPIKEGDYVSLGRLKSISGSQRYPIPDSVKLDTFNSAAVWCRQFNATFGAASFN